MLLLQESLRAPPVLLKQPQTHQHFEQIINILCIKAPIETVSFPSLNFKCLLYPHPFMRVYLFFYTVPVVRKLNL